MKNGTFASFWNMTLSEEERIAFTMFATQIAGHTVETPRGEKETKIRYPLLLSTIEDCFDGRIE
jgi:hypothetical protein